MRIALLVVLVLSALACGGSSTDAPPAAASASAPAAASVAAPATGDLATPDGLARGRALAERLAMAGDGEVIVLEEGAIDLAPERGLEPSCATCLEGERDTRPAATIGLRLAGTNLVLRGAGAGKTVIRTHAGQGLVFDGCAGCALEDVTVTAGERDADRRALNAAVVIREGAVALRRCVVADNVGHPRIVPSVVVGISGVAVREGGVATLEGCRILRSSWDGVAVLRGAKATVTDCVIDGVDRAPLAQVGGGRASGINVAWDGEAAVSGTLIRRCMRGVTASGHARLVMTETVIEEVAEQGLSVNAGHEGSVSADVEGNAFFRIAGCGVLVRAPAPEAGGVLRVVGNAFASTGLAGVATACAPGALDTSPEVEVTGNAFHGNQGVGGQRGPSDMDTATWSAAVSPLIARLRARPALADSIFVAAFTPSR